MRRRLIAPAVLLLAAALGCTATPGAAPARGPGPAVPATEPEVRPLGRIVPLPASVEPGGAPYALTAATRIGAPDHPGGRAVAERLAALLRPATGFRLPVVADPAADLALRLDPAATALGDEGYELRSGPARLTLTARTPAGLFRGVQTVRQQLPADIERPTVQRRAWKIAGGTVTDVPRFPYRGAMLDVARHFFTVEEVKAYIDRIALYKYNVLHLHLTDDQGWRIAVGSRPALTAAGAAGEVGGGPGGFYTKDQYRALVRHAADRHIEVVPEIDMPGHTNAALVSHPELNCDGKAPKPHTGIEVGFSTLCAGKEATYAFADDVLREVAALTPGRYVHIGGDEAKSTSPADYRTMMDRIQPLVTKRGKRVMAWHQIALGASPVPGSLIQYWGLDRTTAEEKEKVAEAARAGAGIVVSPADRAYLDMKYAPGTPLGLKWAGTVSVRRAYDWDPGTYLPGVPESAVRGVEAPLWTETLSTPEQLDTMAFPRLPGLAELGWSPREGRTWDTYRLRLAEQAHRFDALGLAWYRSPEVPWPVG
ncbi:beta-N-acetylhexosaminidase [Streptomyces griseus]|uniref:beta-N-acetylhexosaminidase n=1 Tax=Streptomyces griseus TaxID=1911 RepID=UPI0004C61521|nr:beta-N-acetylhexosaminidase [Streptomyces griseus]